MEIQKTKYISDTPDVELAATIKEVLRFGGNAATKPSERIYKSIAFGVRALPFRDARKCLSRCGC
jgi:hypothetical protein